MGKKRQIRIREKEALQRLQEGKPISVNIFEGIYTRPAETLYEVTHWEDENTDINNDFATLKEAKSFAKKEYGDKPYEIARFEDRTSVGWNKKWWFEKGKIVDVEEQ